MFDEAKEQKVDWQKMRRQVEDRIRKDPEALESVCLLLKIKRIFINGNVKG